MGLDSPLPRHLGTADAESADRAELRGAASKRQGRTELLDREVSRVILGAFYAIHTELGFGFLEAVYANALTVLLTSAGLRVERQVPFEIGYRGPLIGTYRADLVVASRIIVEVKSARKLVPQHAAQLLNYLRASRLQLGLLLNLGEKADFKRVVWTGGG